MGIATAAFPNRPFTLQMQTWLISQDVNSNTSVLGWRIDIYGSNNSTYSGNPSYWSAAVGPGYWEGSFTYDFRKYSSLLVASGQVTIGHAADGTVSYSANAGANVALMGATSAGFSEALPTIPRATTPIVSPTSGPTGSEYLISYSGASTGFQHDIFYSLNGGASYVNLATRVPYSGTTAWTPPHSLLPNSSSVNALILLRTWSGATIIGDKIITLPLSVPATVKPVVSSVVFADSQTSGPDMPTLMGGAGRFVQGWSRLVPTVTSAGSGGSTIVSTEVSQAGQVTPSGTAFTAPVNTSGAVPYSATATDSRTRISDPYVNTVDVKAYNFPNLPTPLVSRTSDAAGNVPSPTGTYLAITPGASVSSLLFGGVEKNLLEWQIRIKPAGGSFTTVQAWTSTGVSGNTWTSKYIAAGPYAASVEWTVEVSIRDRFGKLGFNTASTVKTLTISVPSEQVAFDWDGSNGIGIGKYRTNGMLDVMGAIYQNNGKAVIDTDSLATGLAGVATVIGTIAAFYTAGLPTVAIPGVGNVTVASVPPDVSIRGGDTVSLVKIGADYHVIDKTAVTPRFPASYRIPVLTPNFIDYDPQDGAWLPPQVTRADGIVALTGLMLCKVATASGAVIATLPAGFRPDNSLYLPVNQSDTSGIVEIKANGDIVLRYATSVGTYISLAGLAFPAAGVANWTVVSPAASSDPVRFANGWGNYGGGTTAYGVCKVWKDPITGMVWSSGMVAGGTATSPTPMILLGSTFGPKKTHHMVTEVSDNFGYIYIAAPGNNIGWGGGSGNAHVNIGGMCWEPVGGATIPFTAPVMESWTPFDPTSTSYTLPEYMRSPQGMVYVHGLINGGTLGTSAFRVPKTYRQGQLGMSASAGLFHRVSNAARGRADTSAPGGMLIQQGVAAWFSLDNLTYASSL